MAVLKLLQASDVHEEDDVRMPRWRDVRSLANSSKVDIALLLGDFFDEQDSMIAAELQKELSAACQQHFPKSMLKDVDVYNRLNRHVQEVGGLERLKQAVEGPEVPDELRNEIKGLIGYFEANKNRIKPSLDAFSRDKWLKDKHKKMADVISQEAGERYKRLDDLVGGIKAPVLGVRGNWEVDCVYDMKKIQFVEKKPVTIKGLTFAGAPNWYERLAALPAGLYAKHEWDPASVDDMVNFIQNNGTQEDLEKYVRNVEAGNPLAIPEKIKKKLPTYARLENVKADVLLTHKGPGLMAVEGDKDLGSGFGLEHAMQKMKPKIVLGGHIHGKGFFTDEDGYQGLRSTDRRVYISHVDNSAKKILKIEVYKWADREKQPDQYKDAA